MRVLNTVALCFGLSFLGCGKDKTMEDYRRDLLQQSIARISTVSGSYTGSAISRIDGSNLGTINLKFQARTDISSNSSQVSNEQNATVSGSILFRGLSTAEVVFDNGYYDDVTGDFQVTIPIVLDGGLTSKLSLVGVVSGDKWVGSIEVKGQPDFGGSLNLTKNAPMSNTSAIEVGGARLQQINQSNFKFEGAYSGNGVSFPLVRLSFINRDLLPEQNFYKLFSPVRIVNVNLDFSEFELNFSKALLDDKANTLIAHDPVDQRGTPVRADLSCFKFDDALGPGWDCSLQTKKTLLNLHLSAKK